MQKEAFITSVGSKSEFHPTRTDGAWHRWCGRSHSAQAFAGLIRASPFIRMRPQVRFLLAPPEVEPFSTTFDGY